MSVTNIGYTNGEEMKWGTRIIFNMRRSLKVMCLTPQVTPTHQEHHNHSVKIVTSILLFKMLKICYTVSETNGHKKFKYMYCVYIASYICTYCGAQNLLDFFVISPSEKFI